MRVLLSIVIICVLFGNGWGQIPIPDATPVTENFTSLGTSATATLPANWKMSGAGLGATANWTTASNVTVTTQAAQSGTPTAGGRYNWGTSNTERALGFMTDSAYTSSNSVMAYYRNTSGKVISKISISFRLERYRRHSNTFSLALFTSTNGTTWTSRPAGDIATSPVSTG